MSRARFLLPLTAIVLVACTASVPEVPADRFACEDNLPTETGLLPCEATDWCLAGQCTSRFNCARPEVSALGCEPGLTRCDVLYDGEAAATNCERGIYSLTSTRPDNGLDQCFCPDEMACGTAAGEGEGAPDDPQELYVLPPERQGQLPIGQIGIEEELETARYCVRGCSSEVDCSAGHTCRAAAVLQDSLLADPTSTRHTVGTCYPDVLRTSTTSAVGQLVREACYETSACKEELGRTEGVCSAIPIVVPDHPTIPAGEAWPLNRALVTRCVPREGLGDKKQPGTGCLTSIECSTGVCFNGRCALLCDPEAGLACGQQCRDTEVSYTIAGGIEIEDRVFICRD